MSSPSIVRASPRNRSKGSLQSPVHTPFRHRDSPKRVESPRTPAQLDLGKALSQLQLHDEELVKLRNLDRQIHADELAAHEAALAKIQQAELEAAAKFRESVRLEAENVLQRHIIKEAEEARRKAEAERQRQIQIELANAERERKLREQAERLAKAEQEKKENEVRERQAREVAARRAEEEKRAQLVAAARAREEAEAKAKQDAEDERHRKETERAAKAKEQEALLAKQQATTQAAAAVASHNNNTDPDRIHKEYLVLYQRLKKLKNDFAEEVKGFPQAEKAPVGEGRRLIKANIGKLSYGETRANAATTDQIKQCLLAALANTTRCGRPIPVNDLLPARMNLNDNNTQTLPLIAVYLLVLLAQQVCKIFTSYVHGEPQRAEPIGICMTSIFGWDKLQFQRQNTSTGKIDKVGLISILLAKYHQMCPALFGIAGDQTISAGKRKLGWQLIHDPNAAPRQAKAAAPVSYENRGKKATANTAEEEAPKTAFVLENIHYDRMKGLAIGYSAIALRNASASKTLVNPYPPVHFWLSLAQIINMPPEKVQPTHICVLRYMFGHNGIQRFLTFFGTVGVAVLREAFVHLPQRLPEPVKSDSFTREVMVMVEQELGEKMKFHLT